MVRSLFASLLIVLSAIVRTEARPGDRYTVEFSVLPSVQIVHERYTGNGYYGYYSESRNFTVTPWDNSQFRFSLWSRSNFVVDVAKLRTGDSGDDYDDLDELHWYEVGLGYDFGRGDAPLRPFSTALAGLLTADDLDDAEGFVGLVAGLRFFVHDWAAARVHVAYRQKVPNADVTFRMIDIAAGMGFFL